jgi:hypothetical protein
MGANTPIPAERMPVDHIRYDLLTQQALRAVVRRVLADVSKTGSLPGEHHFYVTFDTRAPGVKLSARLREQYPEEMTIVLQHQFWDLTVTDVSLEVSLSFNGVTEKLFVPLDAIKGFFDPSVQFGLQFETMTEGAAASEDEDKPAPAVVEEKAIKPPRRKVAPAEADTTERTEPAKPTKPPIAVVRDKAEPEKPSGGAEVVRLDRFRKK